MPAEQQAIPVAVPPPTPVVGPTFACTWPAADHVIITSCPGTCKVCIAYNGSIDDIVHDRAIADVNLAGCPLDGRPDIVCVADCSAPCR